MLKIWQVLIISDDTDMEIEEIKAWRFKRGRGYTIDSVESWREGVMSKLDELALAAMASEMGTSHGGSNSTDYTKFIQALGPEGLTNLGYRTIGLTLHTATLYAERLREKTDLEINSYKNEIRRWIAQCMADVSSASDVHQLKSVLARMHKELDQA